ncbi:MAG: hypothetical protein H0W83_01765, partial [Planctomycetes bacterium]|nr:hypothetical protein [Planctomycetota bacterium]
PRDQGLLARLGLGGGVRTMSARLLLSARLARWLDLAASPRAKILAWSNLEE